mmetsp:Transcript_21115/g.68101  ORF Transcript_21115/g.68101 Transcript_21115/m.68101 type:complete len:241 (+) Transcript_21115:46-768(+)
MGRVARYKKIKSCDPFAPKSRKTRPLDRDDPVRDDEEDAKPSRRFMARVAALDAAKTAMMATKKEKRDKRSRESAKAKAELRRRQGESQRQYRDRLQESNQRDIADETKRVRKSNERRKEYLSRKKAEKAGKKRPRAADEEGAAAQAESPPPALDYIAFGEVAPAPPRFKETQLRKLRPKGAPARPGGDSARTASSAFGHAAPASANPALTAELDRVRQAYEEVKKRRRLEAQVEEERRR